MDHAESRYQARIPLEIVHERPSEVRAHVDAVFDDCLSQRFEVAVIISRPGLIICVYQLDCMN